jgi:hypothetical protein
MNYDRISQSQLGKSRIISPINSNLWADRYRIIAPIIWNNRQTNSIYGQITSNQSQPSLLLIVRVYIPQSCAASVTKFASASIDSAFLLNNRNQSSYLKAMHISRPYTWIGLPSTPGPGPLTYPGTVCLFISIHCSLNKLYML